MPEAPSSQAPLPGQLVIEKTQQRDAVVLVLSGELDLASAPMLERELREAEATGPTRVVIDLGGLAFMDMIDVIGGHLRLQHQIVIGGKNPVINLSGHLCRAPEMISDRSQGWSLAEWKQRQPELLRQPNLDHAAE